MNTRDEFKYMAAAYYGIRELDTYELKEYILKEIEKKIRNFVVTHPDKEFDYKKMSEIYETEISFKTKLQDALLLLNQMKAPLDLIILIKHKLNELK
jgi:1,2-phenylacetyl-CoA epoxidase catalytic subunit